MEQLHNRYKTYCKRFVHLVEFGTGYLIRHSPIVHWYRATSPNIHALWGMSIRQSHNLADSAEMFIERWSVMWLTVDRTTNFIVHDFWTKYSLCPDHKFDKDLSPNSNDSLLFILDSVFCCIVWTFHCIITQYIWRSKHVNMNMHGPRRMRWVKQASFTTHF